MGLASLAAACACHVVDPGRGPPLERTERPADA